MILKFFPFKNINNFLDNHSKAVLNFSSKYWRKIKGILSGYPDAPDNKFIFSPDK